MQILIFVSQLLDVGRYVLGFHQLLYLLVFDLRLMLQLCVGFLECLKRRRKMGFHLIDYVLVGLD